MRVLIPGLASPHPLGDALPALYVNDDFTQRFAVAFDTSLAPVLCTLDNLEHYLSPELAPGDFLEWLGTWVGATLDENWPDDRRRAVVSRASAMHRRRGTVSGLAEQIALFTGGAAEVVDNGGVSWSAEPGSALPGSDTPHVTVRVRVADPGSVELGRLDALVAQVKPGHVPHTVEVVAS
ncbi:MAG: phage tail protein [Pseudonocardiales bacterium]